MKKNDKRLKEEIVKKKVRQKSQNLKEQTLLELQNQWIPVPERKILRRDSRNKTNQNQQEMLIGM